ncbi:MAG: transketolase, partial [Alphaproteobacteria bacterium]|nr:transketolase [Alphaproteobacteria bacterium]
HPEVGVTPGVETTTGPLGQGLANAVGMALAEKLLAAEFNKPGDEIVDHFTYVFLGDGCLMEGISHEVVSLAGALRLSKLIVLYDDNGISIDGHVEDWFADDTPKRFEACGWNVIPGLDGHDVDAVDAAIASARTQGLLTDGKPTLLCCKTTIGKGAPTKAGGHDVHGAPLGHGEIEAMRKALGWSHQPFVVPETIRAQWSCKNKGRGDYALWRARFAAYAAKYPEAAAEFERRMAGDLIADYSAQAEAMIAHWLSEAKPVATRKASQNVLDQIGPVLPEMFGGSADLTGSNLTNFKGCGTAKRDQWGRHISWGVREFGMAAAMNGMALHGGYIPYGGTFVTFSDYSRNAIRMAALMKIRVIHVLTHDSIGLGEDGPTHQPIEHASALRLIPGLDVWRPADQTETAVAWASAVARKDGPTALLLSRQALPVVVENAAQAQGAAKGGYILRDAADPKLIIMATGS